MATGNRTAQYARTFVQRATLVVVPQPGRSVGDAVGDLVRHLSSRTTQKKKCRTFEHSLFGPTTPPAAQVVWATYHIQGLGKIGESLPWNQGAVRKEKSVS